MGARRAALSETSLSGLRPTGGARRSESVAFGDLDGDGDLDAFVANFNQTNQVLINQGGTPGDFDLGPAPEGGALFSADVALGDLDGDGGIPAVNDDGLPNLGTEDLLPSMWTDSLIF